MSKVLEKIIALVLVIILVSANLIFLGEYTIVYALSDEELIKQDSSTNNKNIEFNSYFNGETHSQVFDIGSEEAKIYLKLKVNNAGYLQNGTIEFQNANFKIKGDIQNENIQSIDNQNNKIVLNKINNGSDITIELPIEILKNDNVSLDYFNKETLTKFTGTYVDGSGKEKQIEKEVTNKLSWKGNAEAELKVTVNKFVTYATNENYGVMLQTKINSNIKDSSLPIHNTNLEITVPTINNIKPTSVNVIATNTLATNGKADGLEFNNTNYSYDQENGKVTINVSNLVDSISWTKNISDEYLVTYLFEGQDVYNFAKENGIDSQVITNANITVYNNEENILNSNVTTPIKYVEEDGTLTDFSLNVTDKISKGYIYANYDANDKNETEYSVNYVATVNSAKLTTSLEFIQNYDKFMTSDNKEGSTTVGENNYAYNKRIEVNQAEFNKMLGEDGTITIKNEKNETLGIINKETNLENGIYSLDISDKNNNKLNIVTSAPIIEGQLKINVVKAIKGNIDYSKEQMQNFTKMKVEFEGKTNTTTYTAWKEMIMQEPVTKAELEISKKDLTTVVENKNVEIRAVLDTSNVYNALFENLKLKIILPSSIENVDLNSINILLDNELKIKSSQLKEENGQKVIYIELEGKQTEYAIDAEYKGAIVVLNADIDLESLTPSGTSKIRMEYVNENETAVNTNGEVEQDINFVAPTGIVAASGISGYKDGAEDVLSISEKTQTVEIDTYSEKRNTTMKGIIINNYQNDISNIMVLGRIPSQGNKKIDAEDELGTTFTTPLATGISILGIDSSNYTIYYSDNANATKDLNDQNNGWGNTATVNSKSFLVVFNSEYKLESGKKIDFAYNIEIPEKLAPNNEAYGMYKVYYTNNSEIGSMDESKNSAILGITTGKGPELEASVERVNVENADPRSGQIVKFIATIKNIGEVNAENVVLNIPIFEGTKYIKYDYGFRTYRESEEDNIAINLGNIEKGSTITYEYELKMEEFEYKTPTEEDTTLGYPENISSKTMVKLSADNLNGQVESNLLEFKINRGYMNLIVYPEAQYNELKNGDTVILNIQYEKGNISFDETELSNVILYGEIPQGIAIQDITIENSEDENRIKIDNNKFEIKMEEKFEEITLTLKIEDYKGDFSFYIRGKADTYENHYSNILTYSVNELNIEFIQNESSKEYVKELEEYSYNFTINNKSKILLSNTKIEIPMPNDIKFIDAVYSYNRTEKIVGSLVDGNIIIYIQEIDANTKIDLKINVKANLLENDEDKKIEIYGNLITENGQEIKSNSIVNYIEYVPTLHEGEDSPGTNTSRYKITGTAWIDENQDGKRDNGEKTIEGMQIMLLNKEKNSIVKDPDTNENKIVTTSADGTYQFTNIPNGKYIAIFLYDYSNYSLTQYQKQGVSENINSDVIDINITYNGEKRIAATTDIVSINNDNVRNIDIGLCTANKFDLRLDKYVNKITLTTPTIGTKEYSYNNEKLAKVEVLGQNLGKSNAVIEYKIVITNEGSIPGYVKKIVDYLPNKVNFSTELNTDWYLSDNGNIYNASLENEIIKPGEKKEVNLIVSLKITDSALGILDNNAEIYETYNEQGINDVDSLPGNKVNEEDDMSNAEVVVSLVTGKIAMYIVLAVIVLAAISISIYFIRIKVLKVKNNK